MSQTNAPVWRVDQYHSFFNNTGAVVNPNLFLVPDATAPRAAKVPATSATLISVLGVSPNKTAIGDTGDMAAMAGDVLVVMASGTVTQGDEIFVDTASGKEGRGKTFVDFATNGAKVHVGTALTSAADGELFELRYTGNYVKTA